MPRKPHAPVGPPPPRKHCPTCDTTKPARDYWADKGEPDGLWAECKPCGSARLKARRARAKAPPAHDMAWRDAIEAEARAHWPKLVKGWVADAVGGDRAARKQLMEYLLGPPRPTDDSAASRFYQALVGAFTSDPAGPDLAEPPEVAGPDRVPADAPPGGDPGGAHAGGPGGPQEGD